MELAYASALTAIWLIASYFWLRNNKAAPEPAAKASSASELLLVYASQSGTAQSLAETLQQQLERSAVSHSNTPRLLPLEALTAEQLSTAKYVLFVVSTFADGVAPDHAQAFVSRYMEGSFDSKLARLRYAVLALGDRQYADYCAFGHRLARWLNQQGASPMWPLIEVDREDPSALARWQQAFTKHFAVQPSDAQPDVLCRLVGRTLLNEGSHNPSLYHLRFEMVNPTNGQTLAAKPGDIAKILLPSHIAPTPEWRSYSVANFDPQQQRVDLIIRQVQRADGTPGVASHWLTERVDGGSAVPIHIQKGVPVHRCASHAPLILIGAGSGLAGLRAALQYRQQQAVEGDWLITGERDPDYDLPLWDEWRRALQRGQLAYWDACFSQSDNHPFRYVQDALVAHATRLRELLIQGASIYVCGSEAGLGRSVDQHLHNLLGATVIEILQRQRRYLRDVY